MKPNEKKKTAVQRIKEDPFWNKSPFCSLCGFIDPRDVKRHKHAQWLIKWI